MLRKFTPRELELMIKHEISKQRALPEALIIQILRQGGTWRATARFKGHEHSAAVEQDIVAQVKAAGDRLAPDHVLIG